MPRAKENPPPLAGGDGQENRSSNSTDNSIPDSGPNRKPNYWTVIPASVRYDRELPPNAKLLYGELSALTNAKGYCWASNAYFTSLYGLSEDSVRRLMLLLEKRGYIRREVCRDDRSQTVTVRKIWLCHAPAEVREPRLKNKGTSPQKYGDPPLKNTGENNINNNIPPIVPREGDRPRRKKQDCSPEFEAFWAAYPARVADGTRERGAKSAACKAWNKALKSGASPEDIMAALARYAASASVRRGYARNASNWLRDAPWEEDVTEAVPVPGPEQEEELPEFYGGFWNG